MSRLSIRRLRINGFGHFRDLDIGPLDERVTIFEGPNEAGKSTLLEFIRTILFGFPRRRGDRWFPPLAGGRHGGLIELSNGAGEITSVTRYEGKGRGPVEIFTADGQVRDEEYLAELLAVQGEDLFSNLYAFTLEELQSDALLRDENVNRQIYSAGVGERNLPRALADLDDRRKAIYSPRGRKHQLAELRRQIKAIDQQLEQSRGLASRYGRIKEELARSEQNAGELRAASAECAGGLEGIRRLQAAWADFAELRSRERELASAPDPGTLPEDAVARLNAIDERIRIGLAEHDRAERELAEARAAIPTGIDPQAPAGNLERLESLVRGRSAFTSSVRDLPQRRDELARHERDLAAALAALGSDWTVERAAAFQFSESDRKELATLSGALGRSAGEEPDGHGIGLGGGKRARSTAGALAVLIGIGGAGGLLWAQPAYVEPSTAANLALVTMVAIAAAGLGALLLGSPGRRRASREREHALGEWRAWLTRKQLDPSLAPDRAAGLQAGLERARAALENTRAWRGRIEAIERDISRYTALVGVLAESFAIGAGTGDPEGTADALIQLHRQIPLRQRALDAARDELARRRDHVESARRSRAELLAELGVRDSDQLRRHQSESERRERLRSAAAAARERLRNRVADGQTVEQLQEQLNASGPEELQIRAADARARLEELDSRLGENALGQGALRNQLQELAAESDSDRLAQERAVLQSRIEDAEREWVVLTLAGQLLAEARRRYETERQPGIIRTAQSVFAKLSAGRYPSILAPLGSDEIAVLDREGSRKEPRQLSRGTREQLYLALRFGLIAELGRKLPALPVAVDEILVNFDPDRALRSAAALLDLSRTNQLLVFTCHPQTLELFDRAARDLAVPAPAVIELPAGTRRR
ncbi:MAG: AAA family ATPase [Chloroflexi bacterium]|nr:AAA family ATPase [Chloroflexota bacterium]